MVLIFHNLNAVPQLCTKVRISQCAHAALTEISDVSHCLSWHCSIAILPAFAGAVVSNVAHRTAAISPLTWVLGIPGIVLGTFVAPKTF